MLRSMSTRAAPTVPKICGHLGCASILLESHTFTNLILITLQGRDYDYLHVSDEETEYSKIK